ncbi:MAG: HAMP domain-containing protein, partial [Cytophagales bacterium]|nr:HAMP domain-containing protein [Cytophagales bacterium]
MLIVIFVGCVIFTFFILNNTINSNNEINTIYTPSVRKLQEAKLLIARSNALISNWIFVTSDNTNLDKKKLRELMSKEYPTIQKQLNLLSREWDPKDQKLMDSAKTEINALFADYKIVINRLNSFESYADPMVVFDITPMVQEQGSITLRFRQIISILDQLAESQSKNASYASDHLTESLNRFKLFVIIIGLIVVVLGALVATVTIRNIVLPINQVKETLKLMGKGEILKEKLTTSDDEIGEMSAALNYLSDGLQKTADYAEKIGNGNLEATFESLGEKDLLGNSLLEMGKKLKALSEEDRKRNWVTVGLAQFSDILRSSNDLKKLCE